MKNEEVGGSKKGNSPISLPHLVYELDFSGTDKDMHNMWNNATDESNFISGLMNTNKKEDECKIIVVFELPSGGEVVKYCVGETDDKLEVEVRKHGLMLNPQALLYSGIKIGALDENKDDPNTA